MGVQPLCEKMLHLHTLNRWINQLHFACGAFGFCLQGPFTLALGVLTILIFGPISSVPMRLARIFSVTSIGKSRRIMSA